METTNLNPIKLALLFALVLLSTGHTEEARYFRVVGPVSTTITAFRPDGTMVWTNSPTNTTFTVQTTSSLLSPVEWVDYVQIPVTNGVHTNRLIDFNPPAEMAFIPAGSFTMGDGLDGLSYALPLHTNYVSAFYLDRDEVTLALWNDVYDWATNHGYSFDHGASGKAASHPAQSVTWYDCVKWCNARSEMEGRTPAYYTSAAQTTVYRSGQIDLDNDSVKWNTGYRLPTEAEWEKAARGGLSGKRFPWGDLISESQANYYGCTNGCGFDYDLGPDGYNPIGAIGGTIPPTSPVGSFPDNNYGLADMAGNVWEWCWDWSGAYSSDPQTDPKGPPSGLSRVDRSGSGYYTADYCRVAYRDNTSPTSQYDDAGFRTVLPSGQ